MYSKSFSSFGRSTNLERGKLQLLFHGVPSVSNLYHRSPFLRFLRSGFCCNGGRWLKYLLCMSQMAYSPTLPY